MTSHSKVGIVGCGTDKFTEKSEQEARRLIREILKDATVMISGHSPVGGIDIWAEEEAEKLGIELDLKIPKINQWNPNGYGYKARNLDIANSSDIVHVILVDSYPPNYKGMKFDLCYHCKTTDHIKSGGCWTGRRANNAEWHIIKQG